MTASNLTLGPPLLTQHVPCHARNVQALAAAVSLGHADHLGGGVAGVQQAAHL